MDRATEKSTLRSNDGALFREIGLDDRGVLSASCSMLPSSSSVDHSPLVLALFFGDDVRLVRLDGLLRPLSRLLVGVVGVAVLPVALMSRTEGSAVFE